MVALVVDMVRPNPGGLQILQWIRASRPRLASLQVLNDFDNRRLVVTVTAIKKKKEAAAIIPDNPAAVN